ncbi:MAG: tetratricopeptide repeat protein [Calditrichae bacterium]|nr:tetratricopeptide repeat protein [Calditrichia bacterium]
MSFKTLLVILLIFTTSVFSQAKRKVAVIPLKNNGNASLDWIDGGLEYVLTNKLSVLSGFFVIDNISIDRAMKEVSITAGPLNDKTSGQIGRLTGAEVTISGNYSGSESQINFEIFYHNTTNGSLIYNEKLSASSGNLSSIADKIIEQLLLISGVPVSSSERQLMNRSLTKNNQAFESFIKAYIESNKPNPSEMVVTGLFKDAIAKDPRFWEAYYNLGIVYFNSKQYDQSLQQFNKIISALPNFDKPYYGRGLIYEKQKRYTLAIADFKKVTEFNPNDYKPYYYLGKISILNNEFSEAQKYLDQAAKLNPDYAPIYFEYGNLQVAQDQIRKSISDYRKAVELDKTNNKYRQTLGEIYYRSQIYYNALIEFQTIIKSEPNDALANFMLGVTIYKQAVLEELVEAFLDMLDENSGNRSAKQEKKFDKSTGIDPLKKNKVYEDMVDAFTKASQSRPNFMQATFNLALTYMEMGNYNLAEKYFKATILIEPELVRAHSKLAEVYEKTGRTQLAEEQYKKLFYIEPSIFVHQPTLGPEFQYKNILNVFMADLDEKLKRNPNDTNANIVLAKVFKAQGYNGKAANILRSVLSRFPSNKEAQSLLARIEKSQR